MQGQKEMGQALATRFDRTDSMMLRMARSATPLSECTCGGPAGGALDELGVEEFLELVRQELAGVVGV